MDKENILRVVRRRDGGMDEKGEGIEVQIGGHKMSQGCEIQYGGYRQ